MLHISEAFLFLTQFRLGHILYRGVLYVRPSVPNIFTYRDCISFVLHNVQALYVGGEGRSVRHSAVCVGKGAEDEDTKY